ncbi:MAG: phosphocholine cytidylyltransferase family protein [Deltaproteobacteria bacterium]|nr:MAG: phosphocholine cytidylyltransferase family protein [Deltaproteobacteria bacterium]
MTRPRKAIVVAAGMGRRLRPYTDGIPKCLVPVAGRPILARQLDALRAHGVRDVVVVRGYLGDVLEARAAALGGGIRFVDNPDYRTNNILASLFCAEHEFDGPLLVSYSDIVFTADVVARAIASPADIALVIDRDFRAVYEGRTDHPLDEAEVAEVDLAGRVRRVGKRALPPDDAWGEFIGLVKLSAAGAARMRDAWRELAARYADRPDAPFMRAPAFRAAYLTDLLQHLIDTGVPIHPVEIRGQWREIDTVQDLERAAALWAGADAPR